MTYHMARVAHWLQNQSIGYYFSYIDRQNAMNPGAEFLILIPQVIFHSDVFANLIQSFAWLYCIAIVLLIASIIKAENYKKIFATIFAASLPMGILQATSTQNDLLASAFCLSLIGNHFFLKEQIVTGRFPKSKWVLLIAYSISIFSAYLVKPTSVLFASFFLLASLFHLIAFFWKNRTELGFIGSLLKLVPVFVISGLIVLGPDLFRKYNQYGSLTGNRSEVFSLGQGLEVRFANTLKGMFYHSPFFFICDSDFYLHLNSKVDNPHGTGDNVCLNVNRPDEDYIGNSIHFVFIAFVFCILVFRKLQRKKTVHSELALGILFSWVIFHFMIKDQPWISRLQLPFFYSSSLLIFTLPKYNFNRFRILFYVPIVLMILQSWTVLALNASRPFLIAHGNWNREWHYFNKRPELRNVYANFIEYIKRNHIEDVGLVLNGDSWDYPLTWQLMQNGTKVNHVKVPVSARVVISDSLDKIDGYSVVAEGQGFFLFLRNSN